ncbi:HPr-rel-A system PqqD family peptide chaperone [Aquisalimonas sp.]|nr:HPr-rel-A system PqqD family peptide chaperone [Aquisalimonas sp.]
MARPDQRFVLDPAVLWRQMDGEAVVFLPASGDTHRLDRFATNVLAVLEGHTAGLDAETVLPLMRHGAVDDEPVSVDDVAAVLQDFRRLGLVEQPAS